MPTAAEQLNHTDDGLDDLMSLIAPEDADAPAAAPAQSLEEILGDGESPVAPVVPAGETPAAGNAPQQVVSAPATPSNVSDLVERLAQAQIARDERERQEREAAAAREREAEANRRAQLFAPDDLELTDEEKQVYGQSQNVISKLVRRELQRYHTERIAPEFAQVEQMRTQIGTSEQNARAALDRSMNAAIRAAVPEVDTYVQTPEWGAFLAAGIPEFGPGVTRGNLLQAHLQNLNTEAAVALIRAFKPAQAPATPTVAVTPGRAGGGAPASVAAAERSRSNERFPYSRYVEISEKAQRGEISMDKFDKITDFYFDKMEQGLVDMNA